MLIKFYVIKVAHVAHTFGDEYNKLGSEGSAVSPELAERAPNL
jgi:hypothetical protein